MSFELTEDFVASYKRRIMLIKTSREGRWYQRLYARWALWRDK